MKPTLMRAAWLLLVVTALQAAAQFDHPCNAQNSCECESCPGLPDLPLIDICAGSADQTTVQMVLDQLDAFCQSGCERNYSECLLNSSNSDCTVIRGRHEALCSYNGSELCWSRFVAGVGDGSVNCSAQLCLDVGALISCPSNCRTALNATSEYLGCCAASLFGECPFSTQFTTWTGTFENCSVPLAPSCVVPSSTVTDVTPSATPTPYVVPSSSVVSGTPSETSAGCQTNAVSCVLLVLLLTCLALNLY